MTDVVSSLASSIETIAKNNLIAAALVPVDNFLNTIKNPQTNELEALAAIDVLKSGLIAALPQAGTATVQQGAGALETEINAAAAKAQTGSST